jgi:hypothetical protein
MHRDLASRPALPSAQPAVTVAEDAGGLSGRVLALEGLVVYLVLQALTVVFLPALRSARETFYDDVLLGFFGPEKHGLAGLLRSGFLPTWLDSQYGGEPVLANLQHGVLYPGNLPFWLLSTSTALEVVAAVHVALAGLFMWAYCRFALRTGRWGAALAGLVFGLGSVTLQHIILLNQLQVIAWMPLVLLCGHLALERGRLRWVVATGVAVGLQLLAGHPEEWVYTLFALASYGLAWTLAAGPRAWPRRALAAALRLGGRWSPLGCCSSGSWGRRWCCSVRGGGPRPLSRSSMSCRPGWPSTPCCPTTAMFCSVRTWASSGWSPWAWPGWVSGPVRPGWAGCGSGRWQARCSGS